MKYFVLLLLTSLMIFGACSDDDPMIITETITVRDTVIVVQNDTSIVIQRDTTVVIERDTIIDIVNEDSSVVVICVRHAETTTGANPGLSTIGQARALDLSNALSNIDIDAVYSTIFNRTRQTAQVPADAQGQSVIIYDAFDIPGFSADLLAEHKGETVLVVGHSNTTPELINALTGTTTYATFDESTYDNIFIVNMKINGEGVVYHLEYGEDTP